MRVLAITNLFPNAREPNRGIFNLQQFAALTAHCELQVVAPIAWQPWARRHSKPVPYQERWCDIPTLHPSYFYTPGVGRAAYAAWLYASLRRAVTPLVREYRPDALLATWAFPDVVAAAILARRMGLPWVAKVHGTDVNLHAANPWARGQIRWALRQAASVFAVSGPLKQRLVEIGVPASRVCVQHNGVDVRRFRLHERMASRQAVGLPSDRRIVVYVGNLKIAKGVCDLVEAACILRRYGVGASAPAHPRHASPLLVVLVGGGAARELLAEQIRRDDLGAEVVLAGPRPHGEIPDWIAAADLLCLPSHQEGCPNVVLEALACGRPVVASRVGAVPDLIDERCGAVVPARAPDQLAAALSAVAGARWDAAALRERVLPLSWESNARVLAQALRAARSTEHGARSGG